MTVCRRFSANPVSTVVTHRLERVDCASLFVAAKLGIKASESLRNLKKRRSTRDTPLLTLRLTNRRWEGIQIFTFVTRKTVFEHVVEVNAHRLRRILAA